MLLEYGNTVVLPDWELQERVPLGYSRIYYIMSGEVTYSDEELTCRLLPGHLYALPSTQPYHVWRNPSMDFCCTYLHMVFPQAHVTGLIEMRPAQDCLHAYVHALQCAIQEQRVDLLEALSDSLGAFLSGNVRFVSSSPMVNQVRAFIFQHISEEIKVEELSGLQGYNPNYFIKVFSRETGMTPHQYVIQCRMQYAVDLLNRGQSNQTVGEACSYSDTSTFTRAFRKYYGVTPQKYRQGMRRP